MKICAISDVHEQFRTLTYKIKDCDVLVCSGDITYIGDVQVLEDFNKWIVELKKLGTIKHCVACPGNHDKTFQQKLYNHSLSQWTSRAEKIHERAMESVKDYHLLIDQEVVIDNIKFYGTPWTPVFGGGWSFQLYDNNDKIKYYDLVPKDVDVWLGHGPPFGVNDLVQTGYTDKWDRVYKNAGCDVLLKYIEQIKPKYFVCGHLHLEENHTPVKLECGTIVVNAAICNEQYDPIQEPIYFEV